MMLQGTSYYLLGTFAASPIGQTLLYDVQTYEVLVSKNNGNTSLA